MKTTTITIKRLKKDGTFDRALMDNIAAVLEREGLVVLPVDSIYGYAAVYQSRSLPTMLKTSSKDEREAIRLISSFKMLEMVAAVDKMEFDFLHRIWPAEVTVHLSSIEKQDETVQVRMPRSRFVLDIIEQIGKPLVYLPLLDREGKPVYQKKEIQRVATEKCDCLLIVDEMCKNHALPTVIGLTKGGMEVLREGRVSSEELKSLYFLGKDDAGI